MKEMFKLGFILAAFASVACVCLAVVNIFTAPTIAAVQAEKVSASLKVIFKDAETFERAEFSRKSSGGIIINNVYLAKKDGVVIGAGVEVAGPTYAEATILMGLDLNRTIAGIEFLSLGDTPGFGQVAAEPEFTDQFVNLSAVSPLVAETDFDGISGSTITTNGITDIINYAAEAIGGYLAVNHGGKEEYQHE